ncbi:oxidoreductase [Haladaptatus paucihalophilus DX253]|uniref:Ferredoxin subunit of nitrite reductase or a ring-hydroxylating dioxygenase n=1 Tax=Haladaptatus paucihalophilus DX253 TaxID=797209 RepID=E7QWT2_HALPU|nr:MULTISPECIES: Rieske 2Fe-2S domain-containing protein [Haladaptatus]EFW90735.1 oxidoreductase [Haladaptatus paucihalophilus DX253]GKZ15746.1 (2Fe-2S) ferredoxin [Haladaptatus sp. T7]SHK20871.1 Ferredoxin subunit of nitrite reductase or a ring-hydroxylating dioxygenase [Haladaptatus paucihalophilus DX253]
MDENRRIAAVEEIPDDTTFLFTIRNGFDEEEAVLVEADDDIRAWKNYCQHWTDVRLDKGDGASMRDGELVCGKHGALFESDSGVCTYGPCEGAVLDEVDVTVEDGAVYLTDPDYEFVQQGSSIEYDLSSNRSLGFE